MKGKNSSLNERTNMFFKDTRLPISEGICPDILFAYKDLQFLWKKKVSWVKNRK